MLRKADEISSDLFNNYAFTQYERSAIITVINIAREECLKEASNRVKMEIIQVGENQYQTGTHVDKQSILDLVNELK